MKIYKGIGMIYKARYILNKFLQKRHFFFYKLLLKLRKYSIGQYKQKWTTSSLSPSETCSKDHKFKRQIYFRKTTT